MTLIPETVKPQNREWNPIQEKKNKQAKRIGEKKKREKEKKKQ